MIAPEGSAGFVANMEDVLEVYQRPRDPQRPVVCFKVTPTSAAKSWTKPASLN